MVEIRSSNKNKFDFSIIPSLRCNLECPFCMYNSGPDVNVELDYTKTAKFLLTVDWEMINSFGFYGGEPSINLPLYQKFMDLIPEHIPKFIITNGTWSNDLGPCLDFIRFADKNKLHVIISGTPYHIEHQNRAVLEEFKRISPASFTLKGDDDIQPMGRASRSDWKCTHKCVSYDCATRVGLFPDGSIFFQNCNGIYPYVQYYSNDFATLKSNVDHTITRCKERRDEVEKFTWTM